MLKINSKFRVFVNREHNKTILQHKTTVIYLLQNNLMLRKLERFI